MPPVVESRIDSKIVMMPRKKIRAKGRPPYPLKESFGYFYTGLKMQFLARIRSLTLTESRLYLDGSVLEQESG